MIEPNRPLVLCARKEDVPPGEVIPPGILGDRCRGCGAKLLLTAGSARVVRELAAQPVCRRCVPADLPLAPAMTAEQVAELRSLLGPGSN